MLLTILTLLVLAATSPAMRRIPALDDPGWDLSTYLSRPGLRPPLINITRHDADEITSGYWFMAPYANLNAASLQNRYAPYQAGPLIYDNQGELVWSGAHIFKNRNTFDFRLATFNNATVLTFIVDTEASAQDYPEGAGIILDTSYQLVGVVNIREAGERLNFHEFKIIDGRTSLSITEKNMAVDISYLDLPLKTAYIANYGIREIEIGTGNILFEWYPADHIPLPESMLQPPGDLGNSGNAWDCFHTNSVDKNRDGDYLVSMRYTSTIYKISGKDGKIIWRLGGRRSDFVQDFNFSSQHDAKFYSYNSTVTMISFLDNASDEEHRQPWTSATSAVKLVALYENTSPMTAKIVEQFDRPDGGLTKLRGQAQFLPNDGVFAGWSEHGYISEFAPDGHCVLEAKFVGTRFNSYRQYKFDFIGRPNDRPALKNYAYSKWSTSMSSIFYVSWNGATEVSFWSFYGTNNLTTPYQHVGNITKSGFETTYISNQFWAFSYAEAYAANGTKLGTSLVEEMILPNAHKENITLADFYLDKEQSDDKIVLQASKSVLVISGIVLIGLITSSLISISLQIWKRWERRSKYSTLQDIDGANEEAEMTALTNDLEGDDESEDEVGDIAHQSPPQLKRSHARTTSTDINGAQTTESRRSVYTAA